MHKAILYRVKGGVAMLQSYVVMLQKQLSWAIPVIGRRFSKLLFEQF